MWHVGDKRWEDLYNETKGSPLALMHTPGLLRVRAAEIVPTFYERDERGVPRRWVEMTRHAIQTLAPAFNSDRMVRDYTHRVYVGE
jgi:starch phosphorylase